MEHGDFSEPDEPVADVLAAFNTGRKVLTAPTPYGWSCEHYSVTSSHTSGRPVVGCGCELQPLGGSAMRTRET